jgi:hypothetical protein
VQMPQGQPIAPHMPMGIRALSQPFGDVQS